MDDTFFLEDTKCNDSNEPASSFVAIDLDSDEFELDGTVQGTGTGGDAITIEYLTDGLNKVSVTDKNGSVSQKEFSEICVIIASSVDARDEDTCLIVEKCKVDGSVKVDSNTGECTGNSSASCSGTDLYSFLTSDQVTSIQAAFPKGNKCGVKFDPKDPGKKSTLKINLKAKKGAEDCIAEDDQIN